MLALETNAIVVVQLDVQKAFDHVEHRAAFKAMTLQSLSPFSMAFDCSDLVRRWKVRNLLRRRRGSGSSVSCRSGSEVAEVIAKLKDAGSDSWCREKHWTSHPKKLGSSIVVDGLGVLWEEVLEFVGMGLHDKRLSTDQLKRTSAWRNDETVCSRGNLRLNVVKSTTWQAFLWSSSVWTTMKVQRDKTSSWSASMVANVIGVERSSWMEMYQWWRLWHRTGHRLMEKCNMNLLRAIRDRVLCWAAHVARMYHSEICAKALRCRGLQWWRWRQLYRKEVEKDKWAGPHPKQFKIYRWTGWLQFALDRGQWRQFATTGQNIDFNVWWLRVEATGDAWWLRVATNEVASNGVDGWHKRALTWKVPL